MNSVAKRPTDVRLEGFAARLRLTFIRDHLGELLEKACELNMTPRQVLEFFFDSEIRQRDINRGRLALMAAHFPFEATLEGFDMSAQPALHPGVIRELEKMEWIDAGENVLFMGPSGVGKTHLAIALGRKAIACRHSVRFYSAVRLLAVLREALGRGALNTVLREINRVRLLIIDELGYLPLTPVDAQLLFQLVTARYERKSIIVTTNRQPSEWGLTFGDATAASAVLDRLLHHCIPVNIPGESYRLRESRMKQLMLLGEDAAEG